MSEGNLTLNIIKFRSSEEQKGTELNTRKKIFFLMIIPFFIILSSLCAENISGQVIYCITDDVRVRETPSLNSSITGKLSDGDKLVILETSKNLTNFTFNGKQYNKSWYKIQNEKKTIEGWVYSLFLSSTYFPKPVQLKGIDENFEKSFSFCPIGWSRDGKIAFMEYRNFVYAELSSAPGFYIYDTVKQQFVYSKVGEQDLPDRWLKYKVEVYQKLNEFGITSEIGTINSLPFRIDGSDITITSKHKQSTDGKSISHLFYQVNKSGEKVIRVIIRKGDSPGHHLYTNALVSPFKNYAILIVSYCAEVGRDFDIIGVKL